MNDVQKEEQMVYLVLIDSNDLVGVFDDPAELVNQLNPRCQYRIVAVPVNTWGELASWGWDTEQ